MKDKVVVITGSTKGIGFAIAEAFAKAGASVVVNGSSSQKSIDDALQKLPHHGGEHLGCKADVSNAKEVALFANRVKDQFEGCDVLINNAGFTRFIPHHNLAELSEEIFDRTVAVNLKGPFLCVRAFAPLLRVEPPGLILNVASIAATTAMGSSVAYCASKAGLVNMTQSLARALAPGIRVNSISPGFVDTELTKGWEGYRGEQIQKTPLGRLGTSREIAQCVLTIAQNMPFVTGHDFVIDGGRILGA